MNVMLLAAGEGTRLRPHTLAHPKPAIPFLNVPLAYYSLHLVQPIQNLAINTFHLPDQIHSLIHNFQKTYPYQAAKNLYISDEKGQILGSGGGLGKARDFFLKHKCQEIILMNADEVILPNSPIPWDQIYSNHQKQNAIATLFVMDHPEVGSKFGGIWVDQSNTVIGFGKTKPMNAIKGYHFVGVQLLSKKIFEYITPEKEVNILHDSLKNAIDNNEKIELYKLDCHWFETGNENDFLKATEQCLQLIPRNNYLDHFLKIYAPNYELRFFNTQPVFIEQNFNIPKSCIIQDFAVFDSSTKILPESKMKRVVALPGSIVDESHEYQGIIASRKP